MREEYKCFKNQVTECSLFCASGVFIKCTVSYCPIQREVQQWRMCKSYARGFHRMRERGLACSRSRKRLKMLSEATKL